MALRSDGTAVAWGYNGEGELGDGTTTNRITPVAVSGLTGVTQIAAGGSHSMALRSDGTAVAWGYNREGELGDGTTTNPITPVAGGGPAQGTPNPARGRPPLAPAPPPPPVGPRAHTPA